MPDTNEKYLELIISEYATKELFNAYVKAFLDMISPAVDCANSFNEIFKLDNAVGDQLDKLGSLLNLTRELPVSDPDIPSVLNDEYFRMVIKSRILSNHWDGTMKGLADIINTVYPDAVYQIIDNQDMSYQIIMIDPGADMTKSALLFNGYIIPKPAGVRVNYTLQDKPLFGWDSDTAFIKGWDNGIWNNT